jgi:two-component system KDP operon response regulator KdpE
MPLQRWRHLPEMTDSPNSAIPPRVAVLVVEDDPVIRKLIKVHLSGFQVDVFEAGSAQAALAACRSQPPGLVLLDMGLPDRSGVELCLEITSLYPATRVCVVSGAIGPKDRERAFQAGCSAYLLKPFGAQELKTLVAPLLAELAGNSH